MSTTVTVNGFVPDPTNTEHTLTTPHTFDGITIGDEFVVVRNTTPILFGTVVDFLTRESNGEKQLVLEGVDRRRVKSGDSLRVFTRETTTTTVTYRAPELTEDFVLDGPGAVA